MKIVTNNEDFTLFVFNKFMVETETIKKYLKEVIIKLKRRYRKNISGFYNVNVYVNKKIGMIFDFEKEEGFDFFKDIVDLDVVLHDEAEVFLEFEDLFLMDKFNDIYVFNDKYYVAVDKISNNRFYKMLEFSQLVFGERLEEIKNSFGLVVKS